MTIKDGVHGKGLFAWAPGGGHAMVFRTGDPLVVYEGEHVATAQIDQRYGPRTTAPYALKIKQNHFVDAACKRGIGSIANAPRGTNKKTNAKYAMNNVTEHHDAPGHQADLRRARDHRGVWRRVLGGSQRLTQNKETVTDRDSDYESDSQPGTHKREKLTPSARR